MHAHVTTSQSPVAHIDALTDAFRAETQLIEELTTAILQQRQAITHDDIDVVDDTVFSMHRLLLTLNEARARRRSIYRLLGYDETLGVRQLETVLGAKVTPALKLGRDHLRSAAERLSKEIGINRGVLREALTQNESLVVALRTTGSKQSAAYDVDGAQVFAPSETASFSRTV